MGTPLKIVSGPGAKNRRQGFSLIELLIVVAIILIIAAIALPNLLRSRMAANESGAVSSLRTINTAQVTYATNYPTLGYADTLAKLGGAPAVCGAASPANACLLDNVLASASAAASAKSGYYFTVGGTGAAPITTYTYTGLPVSVGNSGQRGFFTDQTAVIRYTTDGSAPTNVSSAIQ
jgi:type IV pilus assembly protein PilA